MILVSKDGKCIVNMESVACVYIGGNDSSIKADFQNGRGTHLATYSSAEESRAAMQILSKKISQGVAYIEMPEAEEIKAAIIAGGRDKDRYSNGRKSKGHGGS